MMVAMPTIGDTIEEALDRQGISKTELAAASDRHLNTVINFLRETSPRLGTVEHYLASMNRILISRGDRRRWSLASIQAGPDPIEPPEATAPVAPRIEMPHQLARTFIAGLRLLRAPDDLEIVPEEYTVLPFYGDIPCGKPVVLEPYPQAWLPVLTARLAHGMDAGNTIVLRAAGASMEPTIHPGDLIVARTDIEWTRGSVVVVNLDGDESGGSATLKRVARGPGGWFLEPDNPDDEAIPCDSPDIRIVAVARRIMRDIELP